MWLREHKLLATAALLLVIAAVSVVWLSRDQKVPLANGGEIVIRRVSHGKTDRWIAGPIWKRLIASVVPQNRLPRRMRTQVWAFASTNDVLFLWLEWRSTNVTNIINLTASAPVPGIVDTASRMESAPLHLQYWIPVSSNRALMGFQVTSFPRRSPTLLLRFYDRRANPPWKPLAETTLRNPARVTAGTRGEGIAYRNTNGLRVFTLTSFTTGLEDRSAPAYSPVTWTALELQSSGPDDTFGSWIVQSVQCSDPTGNIILHQRPRDVSPFGSATPRDDVHALIAGALWPSDPWTLQVTLAPAGVPAEDRVVFRGLRIPEDGVTNALTNVAHIQGSTIRLLSIASASSLAAADTNILLRTRKAITVVADFKAARYTDEFRYVRATDDRGTNVYRVGNLPNTPHHLRLLVLKEAQTFDLELGVRRLRHVEFLAAPTMVRSNISWPGRTSRYF